MRDSAVVNRRGGICDWEPLLYACYSCVVLPGSAPLAVIELLLDHGANPNAHFLWGGQYRFTALTGAFGEGVVPPHPHWQALTKLLIARGADPGLRDLSNKGTATGWALYGGHHEIVDYIATDPAVKKLAFRVASFLHFVVVVVVVVVVVAVKWRSALNEWVRPRQRQALRWQRQR